MSYGEDKLERQRQEAFANAWGEHVSTTMRECGLSVEHMAALVSSHTHLIGHPKMRDQLLALLDTLQQARVALQRHLVEQFATQWADLQVSALLELQCDLQEVMGLLRSVLGDLFDRERRDRALQLIDLAQSLHPHKVKLNAVLGEAQGERYLQMSMRRVGGLPLVSISVSFT